MSVEGFDGDVKGRLVNVFDKSGACGLVIFSARDFFACYTSKLYKNLVKFKIWKQN
jgi:hypothetical protein